MKFSEIKEKHEKPALHPVVNSSELQRIIHLPRRELKENEQLTRAMSSYFARVPDAKLRWIQSAALFEAAVCNGLFGAIGVGEGKTLITLLMPTAMDSKCAVLLVPAQLKKKTLREIDEFYGKHFKIPLVNLYIHSYEELSSARTADLLEQCQPDLIILDEAHKLKRPQSARTKRFLRYMAENPGCRLVALSGTMSDKSITDYAHLCELALGKNSPVPKGYRELVDWGGALDVEPMEPKSPGALKKLCSPGESVREGFRRRLAESPGVIITTGDGFQGSIVMKATDLAIPPELKKARKQVQDTWAIGDVEITEAPHYGRIMKQLSCGFYYTWRWPNGEDKEWLELRREWFRELRYFLRHRSRAGLDSPFLVTEAVKKGKIDGDIRVAWLAWAKVMDRPEPETVPVWIDDFVLRAALKWAKREKTRAIIWYEHRAFETFFRHNTGLRVYGAGDDATGATEDVIVCSIRAQGTGKNLQHNYHKNLITSFPPSGEVVQQLLGRTHRPGQPEDEIYVEWFAHTEEMHKAFFSANERAKYMHETTGEKQKLLQARHV